MISMGFFTGLGVIFAGGVAAALLPSRIKGAVFLVMEILGSLLTLMVGIAVVFFNQGFEFTLILQVPLGETIFRVDSLSGFFILLFSLVYPLVCIFSQSYMIRSGHGRRLSLYYFSLAGLMASMVLVVSVQNALGFLVVWEVMTLTSFLLTAFEHEKKEVLDAALFYLIAMHVGFLFLLGGLAFLSSQSGSLDFQSYKNILSQGSASLPILFIIFFIGFGTKAGFFPFHTWLPKAHPAAPAPVSALMSALMLKTGIYGIFRFISLMGKPSEWAGYLVLCISLITAVLGILYAMAEKDIKKQLAYSSIENIGLIGTGIGVGLLGQAYGNSVMVFWGYGGAFLHLFNHGLYKASLFMLSGTVYLSTHTRNMELMGGLGKKLPITSLLFLLGSLAISGLPPLSGFVSEFLIYFSLLTGLQVSPVLFFLFIATFAILAMVGALALITFSKSMGLIFLGQPKQPLSLGVKERWTRLLGPGVLTLIFLVLGLFPQGAFYFLGPLTSSLTGQDFSPIWTRAQSVLQGLSNGVILFYLVFLGVGGLRSLVLRKKPREEGATWNCAYPAPDSKIQYSASSYTLTSEELASPLMKSKARGSVNLENFPKHISRRRRTVDWVEVIVRRGFMFVIERFFNLVTKIQSNTHQQYVVYTILFIIANFIWISVLR